MNGLTQYEKNLNSIADFRMFDDAFMSVVFDGQTAETELLIQVILGRDDISVIDSKSQFFVANPYGRGIRLDIFAKDKAGNAYHFEVERIKERASAQRARFTGALVDAKILQKGHDPKGIPNRFTIFITEEDKYGKGLPLYHVENTIRELDNQPHGDGGYIIYVNGEYRNTDTPIGKLMHDFACKNADDILNPLLKARVRMLKETEGGREAVCQIMENRINEEKIELAKEAISRGELTLNQIAEVLKMPLAFVEELAKSNMAYA